MPEFIDNLGREISNKTVEIISLESGSLVILGTPKLNFKELNELIGVCHHQIEHNVKCKRGGEVE